MKPPYTKEDYTVGYVVDVIQKQSDSENEENSLY